MRAAGHASSSAASQPALVAGRYRIDDALGRGGAAQVFRVTDISSGAQLALKRLNAGVSKRLRALFELEYRTLASLSHPGTVEVFEYGRDGDAAFYTMELLHGEDLKAHAPLSWREACAYLRDAAQALGLLHARKLIHRDVSPRNLWRLPNGRVKLIDFGALAPFGTSDHLMGTPPLVPPEALRQQPLDQRADLYALGGVGYYLLTGLHAYPARDFDDLPLLWAKPPLPASQLVSRLLRSDLAPVPAELDALLASLLSQDVRARPSNTPELIDRLDTLLGNARPSQTDVAELHLSNTAFVGRTRERRALQRHMLLASRGRGQSVVIEAESGLGRTRLLKELSLEARVLPSTVLHVHAASYPGMYGLASALGLRLLDALPGDALRAAMPHAGVLAHASPRLRERLGVAPTTAHDAGELRVRMQGAFRDWFLALSKRHVLAVLIDGFEHADDGSGAFLLALANARKSGRVLLVCTLSRERTRVANALERALLRASHVRRLVALSEPETFDLLHSVFGAADHLARLASRLQRVTRGNPGHVLELCGQLVRGNVIGFSHGNWLLPQEVSPEHLSSTREQALTARLSVLPEAARKLARVLSLPGGNIPLALGKALALTVSEHAYLQLGVLLDEDVLARDDDGVHFAHEPLRTQLTAELGPEQRRAAQRVLGEYLLALPAPTTLEKLRAGVSLLDSGDERGARLVAEASQRLALVDASSQLCTSASLVEEALRLFRAQQRTPGEQAPLLAALSMAGYYCDRRFALRYGEATIKALEQLTGLTLARRLRGFFGRKLGLLVALAITGLGSRLFRRGGCVPSFGDALLLLFSCMGTLAGSSTVCMDPEGSQRYGDVLRPFAVLGPKHLASFMYEYCSVLAASVRDRWGNTLQRWQQVIARLDQKQVKGMPEALRLRCLGGALFASGVLQAQRDGDAALRAADRLEQLGLALDRMSADQVRTVFYAHQGNARLFAQYAERAELHAIQQGTSWQIETWFASSKSSVDLRTHDVMGMKQASEQLQRLSQTIPSLDRPARRARGTYLMMRKKYSEALPWLEECLREEPLSSAGWSTMHGVLARVYNRMGEYERARTTCLRALLVLEPEELTIPGLYLIVQTEVLVAEAGLRRVADAQRGLAALIAQHEPNQGPLTMGQLHEAGLDIALLGRDEQAARMHFEETKRWYMATGVPSLVQRCETLAARLTATAAYGTGAFAAVRESHTVSDFSSVDGTASRTVERMLGGGRMNIKDRANRALQILAEHSRSTRGFLYLLDPDGAPVLMAALQGEQPEPALASWVERRIAHEREDERTMLDEDDDAVAGQSTLELHLMREGTRTYRVLLLIASGARVQGVVGAAVVASTEGAPLACPGEVLSAVAYHLQQAVDRGTAESSASFE